MPLLRRAVRAAAGVTCVGSLLANYVRDHYRSCAPALVLENAIRSDLFHPMDREDCRKQTRIPPEAKIIGTAGALYENRGINTLYRGFEILAAKDTSLHLAVAGPRRSTSAVPHGGRTHDLGVLTLIKVPIFFNALDVAVVCNRDSSFGRYNFPQKAREIIACKTPLVAAEVGAMKEISREYPECLFPPNDPASLARAIHVQLSKPTTPVSKIPSWSDMATQLEN